MLSRRDLIVLTISPALVLSVFLAFVVYLMERGRVDRRATGAGEDTYAEVMQIIEDEYVTDIPRDRLIYGAMKGMLAELDEYSRGMDPDEWREFTESSEGRSAGIGVRAGRIDGDFMIFDVVPDSPAAAAGLMPGDKIVAIDGRTIVATDPSEAVRSRMSGPEGSSLQLDIVRGDAPPKKHIVIRGEYRVDSVHTFDLGEHTLIRIESFSGTTAVDVKSAVETALEQKKRGLILDLRGNGGGSLQAAVDIVGIFLETECVLTSVGRRVKEVYATSGRPIAPDLPLVCLVDGDSASASEVVAGAIQDYRRALIVGEHTFGKGVVQNVYALETRQAGVKLTTSRYTTPAGRFLQRGSDDDRLSLTRGGIVPDRTVKMDDAKARAVFEEWDRRTLPKEIAAMLRKARPQNEIAVRETGAVDDPQLDVALAFLEGKLPPMTLEGE